MRASTRDVLAFGAVAVATAGVIALGGLGGVALRLIQLADYVAVALLRAIL
jgi:hypothetical protein